MQMQRHAEPQTAPYEGVVLQTAAVLLETQAQSYALSLYQNCMQRTCHLHGND